MKKEAIIFGLGGQGGSAGTTDYSDLSNKPQINSTTLSGNKSSSDLGLQDEITAQSPLSAGLVSETNDKKFAKTDSDENLYVGGVQKTQFIDKDSYDALVTKQNRLYFIYPTPASNGGE